MIDAMHPPTRTLVIRGAVDELRTADHPFVRLKSMSRADRDRQGSGR